MSMHRCDCSWCGIDSSPDKLSALSVDISIVWGLILLCRTLWTVAACGKVMPRSRTVGEVARSRNFLGRFTRWQKESDLLEQIKRQLLPAPAVSPPKATPIPSDYDLLIQRLLGTVHPVQPVAQERSRLTDIEILLQSMLPVGSVAEVDMQLPAHRQESTAGCFLCGLLDHTTERCPVLHESFPFLPPGWRAERVDDEFLLRPPPKGAACQQAGNVD